MSNPGNGGPIISQTGIQEIPQAAPQEDVPVAMVPLSATQQPTTPQPNDINSYMSEDQDISGLGTMRDFMAEGEPERSTIGIEMREARKKLKTGEESDGLLIVKVERNSAAAKAGLKAYQRMGHNVLTGAAIGAAMVFPPAILVLPVIDYTEVGESYDMIIGIDGNRVSTFIDFEERMRNIQPGELVYLNVVRNGKRLQIPVPVPTLSTSASN